MSTSPVQSSPLETDADAGSPRATGSDWLPLLLIGAALLAAVAAIILFTPRGPLRVSLTDAALLIEGTPIDLRSVRAVALVDEVPALTKVSGLNSMTTLRGWFRSDTLGEGQLWVRRRSPPYLEIRTTWGFVLMNMDAPDETRALYERLRARIAGR